MGDLRAKAIVTVTLEVRLTQPWGKDCTVEQIHKQGRESALSKLRGLIGHNRPNFEIVGEPVVRYVVGEAGDA